MARHKDVEWTLPEGTRQPDGSRIHGWDALHAAILMDIRDELKRLNALLYCTNFLDIPLHLRMIRRNTTKPKKRKPK